MRLARLAVYQGAWAPTAPALSSIARPPASTHLHPQRHAASHVSAACRGPGPTEEDSIITWPVTSHANGLCAVSESDG